MKVLILAALKQEIKYVLKELGARESVRGTYLARQGKVEIIIAQTGMGVENARLRTQAALVEHKPSIAVSIGFAGALYEEADYGEVVCPSKAFLYPGSDTIEFAGKFFGDCLSAVSEKAKIRQGAIVTLSNWIEKPELKGFLPPGLPYPVCDMETFPIANAVLKYGAVFFAIRAITDKAGDEIGIPPMQMADANGQISVPLAVWRLVSNPRLIPNALKFRGSSEKAARTLALGVKELIHYLSL